jgi:hypothetical protein
MLRACHSAADYICTTDLVFTSSYVLVLLPVGLYTHKCMPSPHLSSLFRRRTVHPSPACVNRKGAACAGEWAASNVDDDLGELLPLAPFQSQYFDPEQRRCCIPCP